MNFKIHRYPTSTNIIKQNSDNNQVFSITYQKNKQSIVILNKMNLQIPKEIKYIRDIQYLGQLITFKDLYNRGNTP